MDVEQRTDLLAREPELGPDLVAVARGTTPFRESMRRFTRDTRAVIAVGVFVFLVFAAFFFLPIYEHIGPTISRQHGFSHVGPTQYHGPSYLDDQAQDEGPSGLHWLGTDDQGGDLLARLLAGIQVSLFVAILVVGVLDVGLGVLFGVLAGYYGGVIDTVLARFTDLIFAFPGLLFAVLVNGIFGDRASQIAGNNGRILLVSLTLGLTIWPQMARYVRGQTLQLKEQQYIEAARTVGTTSRQIITRHIIPNVASLIFVAATLDIATTVINEGVLSLLGLGVQLPGSSLGLMIHTALPQIAYHPLEDLLPTFTLIILVLSFSFIGDGLRDAFDPRSKD